MAISAIKIISSLEKIYDGDPIPESGISYLSMLKNEKKSFQVAVKATEESETLLKIESSLGGLKAYSVEHIRSDHPMHEKNVDDYYRFSESGYYPDLLLPAGESVKLRKGVNVFWVEADGRNGNAGIYKIDVTVGEKAAGVTVEIIDAELDFGDFVYTNWFHTDCLMSYYKFDVFSDEYWRVTENFLKTASDYGMTCVLTPLFTPALDTEVGKERPTVQLVDVTVRNGDITSTILSFQEAS